MRNGRQFYVPIITACTLWLSGSRMPGQDGQPQTTAEQISHFTQTLSVPTPKGAARKVDVQIDDWDFPLGDTEFEAPPDGTVIMQVRQGSLSVRSARTSKTYSTGDYWVVPAGAHVTISLPRSAHDSVIVRTITATRLPEEPKSTTPVAK